MQIVTYFQLNEKFILAGEGKGYCYMSINCQGRHIEGTASLLKSECCDGMNGDAWGKAGEDKCFPCETSNQFSQELSVSGFYMILKNIYNSSEIITFFIIFHS